MWIFHIHIRNITSKNHYETFFEAFAPYHHDDENHIDSLTPLLYEDEQKQHGALFSPIFRQKM